MKKIFTPLLSISTAFVLLFAATSCLPQGSYKRTDVVYYLPVVKVTQTDYITPNYRTLEADFNKVLRIELEKQEKLYIQNFMADSESQNGVNQTIHDLVESAYPFIYEKVGTVDFTECIAQSTIPQDFGGTVDVYLTAMNQSLGFYYTDFAQIMGTYTVTHTPAN